MGNSTSQFSEEEISDYCELTFLTKREIRRAWEIWTELVARTEECDTQQRFSVNYILELRPLKENPFASRIVRVFSSAQDDRMSFEDFLDMLSVMSPEAPFHLKAHYAFHIYDMNENGSLDPSDLDEIIDLLAHCKLNKGSKCKLVQKVLDEIGANGDGISEEEFEHFLTKCPEFCSSFKFSL